MCKCTPGICTPWCGKPGCEPPPSTRIERLKTDIRRFLTHYKLQSGREADEVMREAEIWIDQHLADQHLTDSYDSERFEECRFDEKGTWAWCGEQLWNLHTDGLWWLNGDNADWTTIEMLRRFNATFLRERKQVDGDGVPSGYRKAKDDERYDLVVVNGQRLTFTNHETYITIYTELTRTNISKRDFELFGVIPVVKEGN